MAPLQLSPISPWGTFVFVSEFVFAFSSFISTPLELWFPVTRLASLQQLLLVLHILFFFLFSLTTLFCINVGLMGIHGPKLSLWMASSSSLGQECILLLLLYILISQPLLLFVFFLLRCLPFSTEIFSVFESSCFVRCCLVFLPWHDVLSPCHVWFSLVSRAGNALDQ